MNCSKCNNTIKGDEYAIMGHIPSDKDVIWCYECIKKWCKE